MIVQRISRARLRRAVCRSAVALLLMGGLGGCELLVSQIFDLPSSLPASQPPYDAPSNQGPAKPSPMDRPGAIVPAAPDQPQSQTQNQTEAGPESGEPEIAALPPEPKIEADPERLLGMEPEAVTELLGPPAFIRTDRPSLLWRYRGAQCLLDLFLYAPPAAHSTGTRVLHYTVQANGGPELSAEKCLQSLLRARIDKATG